HRSLVPPQQRGLFWLGSAAVVARAIDVLTLFGVLFFISKEQLGVATIAWTIGMILEAVCRLGLGTAILQAENPTRIQLDTVFWMMTLACVGLGITTIALSPILALGFHEPNLFWYLLPSISKIFFLVWAEIPIQMLNRAL